MRRAARIDANKAQIVAYLRGAGCSVYDLKQPVDLLVGKCGHTALVEIKDGEKSPSKQALTPAQQAFMLTWRGGAVSTIRDVEGARRLVQMLDGSVMNLMFEWTTEVLKPPDNT